MNQCCSSGEYRRVLPIHCHLSSGGKVCSSSIGISIQETLGMTSRRHKLKHLFTVPTVVACITFVVVCLASFSYLRCFLVLHSSAALPLDTLPLFIVLHPEASKLRKDVTTVARLGDCIPDSQECPTSTSKVVAPPVSTFEQENSSSSSRKINLWNPDDNSSSPSNASYDVELEGLDLRELLRYLAPNKRRQWLKQHWSDVKILQSDDISERFPGRVKSFFNSAGECTPRFFMTWISPLAAFKSRELLCLLSVFRHHPSACVVVMSRSLDSDRGREVLQPLVDLGYRVMAIAPDLPYLFSSTPAQSWLKNLKKGRVDPGEISFRQNLSNILRLVALYKYGGIYLDNDVVVLRSMSNLSNAIGAQSQSPEGDEWYRVNNAVLVFDKGHPVLRSFIKEFALTFNGSKWGHNGPYLATRVLKRIGVKNTTTSEGCKVLPTRAFYPVSWLHIPRFYESPKNEGDEKWQEAKLQVLFRDSYAVHLWNKETGALPVQRGSMIDRLFRWIIEVEPSTAGS